MIGIRCKRCDRHARLSVTRILAQHGPDVSVRRIMQAQIGDCPRGEAARTQNHCDPCCLALVRLFGTPTLGG